jgi:hypothetical protein
LIDIINVTKYPRGVGAILFVVVEILIGIWIATTLFIWWSHSQQDRLRQTRLEEEAYRLFFEYHAACKRDNTVESRSARGRYLEFLHHHALNTEALDRQFVKRLGQGTPDLNAIVAKRP